MPAAISKLLAETARENLADVIRQGIASPDYTTYVNGREGADEDTVVPPGPIVYVFDYVGSSSVKDFALYILRNELSPDRSGHYKASFIAMANGRILGDGEQPPPGAELVITNTATYARKYEAWQKYGRKVKLSMRMPNGAFETARKLIQKRFGILVRVEVQYIVLPGAYRLRRHSKRKDRARGMPITAPALIIYSGSK